VRAPRDFLRSGALRELPPSSLSLIGRNLPPPAPLLNLRVQPPAFRSSYSAVATNRERRGTLAGSWTAKGVALETPIRFK
jgi:hypothetical protein